MLVLDLSDDVAGRFCAGLLAMSGADVVRRAVADPAAGGPPVLGSERLRTCYLDARKRRVADLSELLPAADVAVTSYPAAGVPGDTDLRAANPAIVHVTTSSFGTTGPYRDRRGGSLVDWAAGGYLFLTGDPDREPLAGPEDLCAYVAGYTAAIAVEAALARRDRGGRGAGLHVDVSTMEAMCAVHQSTFSRLGAGIHRTRTGRYTEVYPLVVRPCRDGHLSLGVNTDEEFDRFAVAIGHPELAADPRFAGRAERMEHRDELDALVDPLLAGRDAGELVELLQRHRVPASKVQSTTEVLADPQLAARGFWDHVEVDGCAGRMPGDPLRPAAGTPPVRDAAPGGPADAPPDAPADAPPGHHRAVAAGGSDDPPLTGVLVLDLTAYWAGPSATRVLADLGARVVRVERPGSRVDATEDADDPNVVVQDVFFHQKTNRGKESVVVDLRTGAGLGVVRALAARADVVVQNFRPGVAAAWGLDHATLAATNRGLVSVALYGFGGDGPRAWWGSYGPTIEAASSIEHRTGYPGGEPLRLGHTLPDGVGGLVGALAALRGLRHRRETGVGLSFDLSQLEAYCAMSGDQVLASSLSGADVPRPGNGSFGLLAQGVYRCAGADEWVAVAVADRADLGRLAGALGDPALAAADAPAPPAGPVPSPAGPRAVHRALAAYAAPRAKAAVAETLQRAGLAAFPVVAPAELATDPHLDARGFFAPLAFRGRDVPLPGSPLRTTPPLVRTDRPAPRVGEHTHHVLRTVLGLDEDRIAALVASGAVTAGGTDRRPAGDRPSEEAPR